MLLLRKERKSRRNANLHPLPSILFLINQVLFLRLVKGVKKKVLISMQFQGRMIPQDKFQSRLGSIVKHQHLKRKYLTLKIFKNMVMASGYDSLPLILRDCLMEKMLLGISWLDSQKTIPTTMSKWEIDCLLFGREPLFTTSLHVMVLKVKQMSFKMLTLMISKEFGLTSITVTANL